MGLDKIITALDTGTRRGEMLALRCADIDFARGLIVLRGETTKSKKTRLVPISTQRLRAVLQWLRLDAEGKQKPDEMLVFSNEVGEPLPHFHDAWLRTVLRAHGIKPRWAAGLKYKGLSRESKDAFRKINLRWHDLRHDYASRLVEARSAARAGSRPARACVDHHDRALRQPEAGEPADRGDEAGERADIRAHCVPVIALPAKAGSYRSEAGSHTWRG